MAIDANVIVQAGGIVVALKALDLLQDAYKARRWSKNGSGRRKNEGGSFNGEAVAELKRVGDLIETQNKAQADRHDRNVKRHEETMEVLDKSFICLSVVDERTKGTADDVKALHRRINGIKP